jgi:molybdate transport system substrate-binding protein
MNRALPVVRLFSILLLVFCSRWVTAEEIRVAVASNFADTIKTIAARFEAVTEHKVVLIFGATGKLYAQISNGAPYDAYFAADVRRPERLEAEGVARPGTRFTYAVGRLLLWSPKPGYVDPEAAVLEAGRYRHLAIANPRLAPYGRAAQQFLQARGVWDVLQGKLVRGENIGQTFQFVRSGNVELGLVARSQVQRPGHPAGGSWWAVPQALYSPIAQQAVLLRENDTARDFLAFVRSKPAQAIIESYGYETP